jgi:hypothetical protein
MRKTLVLMAAAALLSGLAVGVAQIHSASAITRATSFTIVAPATDETELDFNRVQGGTPGAPSQGDMLIFSGPVRPEASSQRRLGRIDGVCTTTSTPAESGPEEDRQVCTVTVTLGGRGIAPAEDEGEIYLQGVGRVEAEEVVLGVVGGKQDFQNARGQASFDYSNEEQVTIDFELIP